MTNIAWNSGGPVFRDGKIGAGQGCCCCCAVSFSVRSGVPYFETEDGPVLSNGDVDEIDAQYEWLSDAMESLGYTVTLTRLDPQGVLDACDPPEFECLFYITLEGTANCCNHPAAGNVMDNPNWADLDALPGGDAYDFPGSLTLFWEWSSSCTLIGPGHPPSVVGETNLPGAYARPSFPYRGIGFYVPRCAGASCPEGCPELGDCNLVVVVESIYGTYEAIDAAASGFIVDEYENCQLAFTVTGVEPEDGGDITGLVTIGYGNDCAPVVSAVTLTRADEGSCPGACAPVFAYLECNPLP